MGKWSLLDIVQAVLSAMDSDEVNSIDDTVESQQVAAIVRSVYQNMISNRNWPHTKRPVKIVPYSDSEYPTHMRLQDEIKELCFINYNVIKDGETRKRYQRMTWLEPDDFLRQANSLNTDAGNVDIVVDPSGIEIAIRNDMAPKYYTSFDDDTLVFNSYNKEVDDTLQQSKTQAHAYIMPKWSHTDDFVPDLPSEAFMALIAEVKSVAFVEIKQQENAKAEQTSRRQQAWLARKDWRVHGGIQYPDYGRRGRKGSTGRLPFDNSSYINRK